MPAKFGSGGIEFTKYMFPLGERARPFRIPAKDIAEVLVDRAPPEVVLHSGEVLFVEAAHKTELQDFASANAIALGTRLDIWDLLTQPYLDTEFGPEDEERTLDLLTSAGIPREEAGSIRRRIGPKVLRYNSFLWDWVSLSHADVLCAFGLRNRLSNALSFRRRKAFYDWCNAIAARSR